MKRALFIIVAAMLLQTGWPVLTADEIVLGPDTKIQIVMEGALGNSEQILKRLLEKYLMKVLDRANLDGTGTPVTIRVVSRAEHWHQIPPTDIKDLSDIDAFEVEIKPAEPSTIQITGMTALAAGFGIMHFLEQDLGVFWAFPGDLGLCLPEARIFRLKARKERVAPFMVSRFATGFQYLDNTSIAKVPPRDYSGVAHEYRNFFHGFDYYKNLRFHALASPSHNMINIFPVALKATEPDIFPIKDGQRWFPPDDCKANMYQCWHPCYTSPKTLEIACAKAREAFQKKEFCFSLGINDGRRIQCQCPECQAAGFPQSYYQFVIKVAERLKSFYPPHLVGVLAYGDVRFPPKDLNLPDNVLVINATGNFEEWYHHARELGVYEYFEGQGFWVPFIPLGPMRSNSQYYKTHNIRFYRGEWHPLWAFDAPKVYLHARQLWDPDVDLNKELLRFCRLTFAEGGEAMADFYRHWAKIREADVDPQGVSPLAMGKWPRNPWRMVDSQFQERTFADFEITAEHLKKARATAGNELVQKRLTLVETFFEESRTLFQIFQLNNRVFDADGPLPTLAMIKAAVRLKERHRELLTIMSRHPEWFEGTSATVDKDLNQSWARPGASSEWLVNGLNSAIATTVFRLNESGASKAAGADQVPAEYHRYLLPFEVSPLHLHHHATHPSYKEWGWVPMVVTNEGPSLCFQTGPTDQRITEHEILAGTRKCHFVAPFVANRPPSNPHDAYLLEFDAQGRNGRMRARIIQASPNKSRDTLLVDDFGNVPRKVKRRLVIQPGISEIFNFYIYLTWEPADDQAPLAGRFTLSYITFGSNAKAEYQKP